MAWQPRFQARLHGGQIDVCAVREALHVDGYVILKRFFPWSVVEDARRAAAKLVDALANDLVDRGILPSLEHTSPEAPFEHRLMRIREALGGSDEHIPRLFRHELHSVSELFDVFFEPGLLDLMLELTGADEIRLFPNYTMRPKMPGCALHQVAWHQDAGLSPDGSPNEASTYERMAAFGQGPDGLFMVNCWTSLVPANRESGCMKFIPQSHRKGLGKYAGTSGGAKTTEPSESSNGREGKKEQEEEQGSGANRQMGEEGTRNGTLSTESATAAAAAATTTTTTTTTATAATEGDDGTIASTTGLYATQISPAFLEPLLDEAIDVETEPGDLVLFNNLLFHSNQENKAKYIRWSIDWRYQDSTCETHREEKGHIARSLIDIDREVQTPEEWASLTLR
eukprot:UC1_evm2s1577